MPAHAWAHAPMRAWGLALCAKGMLCFGHAWAQGRGTNRSFKRIMATTTFTTKCVTFAIFNESDDSDGTVPLANFTVPQTFFDRDGNPDEIGDVFNQQVIATGLCYCIMGGLINPTDHPLDQLERVVYENGFGLRNEDILITFRHAEDHSPVGQELYTIPYADFI